MHPGTSQQKVKEMFNQGVGGAGRSTQASAAASHNNSGNSALMAATKLKRNKASPKAPQNGVTALDPTSLKSPGSSGPPTSLKYAQGASSQQNFLDKYSTKTRNKIGQTVSAQPAQAVGNSDSVSSGNGGQPAMYPGSQNSRKMQASGQPGTSYKAQGATSYSPKGASQANQAGKLLFVPPNQHLANSGMQGFEEATKRQEHMTSSQQHMMAIRNPNYMLAQQQRSNNGGSKKELLRSEDYARQQQQMQATGNVEANQMNQQAANVGNMSPEYYSLNQRTKGTKPNSPEGIPSGATSSHQLHTQQQNAAAAARQAAQTSQAATFRSKSKQGVIGVATNFMKRRVSEDKAGDNNGKIKPTIAGTRGNAIAYAEYLDHNKARSPKVYPSKHLEQLKQVQGGQLTQTQMFNARAIASRPQVSSQTKQYQYLTNGSGNKTTEEVMYASNPGTALAGGKSRNTQVTATTSQGSMGAKYKSTSKIMQQRDSKSNIKTKFMMKSSPKYQASPTQARMAPSLSSQGGLFGGEPGRNVQNSIRTKHSLGATSGASSGTMNCVRASSGVGQNNGLSPTAQYKKVLMKGPMPLMGGKILDDNDDEEDDYDDDDMDEQSPQGHAHINTMGGRSNDEPSYADQASPQQQREKEQQIQQRAVRMQSQREQYQKQQRRLLRNIWIFTEKGNFQACYELLIKQDPKLAQALLNECNSDGWTPLHVASNEGHVEMIEIFSQFGAHLDCKAKNLRTPLHVACIRGNAQVLQALLIQGADYDAKDCDGNTPCHMISQYGHTQCLTVLLEKHPKLVTRNKDGVSPMDVAYNKEILAIFQDYINRVQNIFASQQSSSKYSTSSRGSVNESGTAANAKDGASSKVPNSLSKPDRQLSQNNLRQMGRTSPEEVKTRLNTNKPHQQKTVEAVQREPPKSPTANQVGAQKSSNRPQQTSAGNNRLHNKNVPIHDSLSKNNEANKHKKTRSQGQPPEEAISSTVSSQPDETTRVGPEDFMPLKMLGSGSFGEVYLVREIRTSELYAMKVLTKAKIFGNNLVRYAKTERDVLSYTKHPFIVGLNYAFQTETKLFLILDFCPGGDLGRVLQREGRLSEERARKYLCEVLLAIEALHKRDIIFRDLKPDNVVIDTDGHACLTDFGLSKEGVFDPSRGAKSFCGSVAYLAPEMIRKAGHGKSVDWYLLGVILYEMIVGQPPYFSESKDQLFNNIQRGVLKLPVSMSQEAKNLIVHLLNRNPSKRLGAGAGGAGEIKGHPFFQNVDWDDVGSRRLEMPAPRYTIPQYTKQYENFNCTEEQKKQIFEDAQDSSKNDRVEGWSFVQRDENMQVFNLPQVNLNGERREVTQDNRRIAVNGGQTAESVQQPQNNNNQQRQHQDEEKH